MARVKVRVIVVGGDKNEVLHRLLSMLLLSSAAFTNYVGGSSREWKVEISNDRRL